MGQLEHQKHNESNRLHDTEFKKGSTNPHWYLRGKEGERKREGAGSTFRRIQANKWERMGRVNKYHHLQLAVYESV